MMERWEIDLSPGTEISPRRQGAGLIVLDWVMTVLIFST